MTQNQVLKYCEKDLDDKNLRKPYQSVGFDEISDQLNKLGDLGKQDESNDNEKSEGYQLHETDNDSDFGKEPEPKIAFQLNNLNFKIEKDSLTMIIGKIGSGKSS